MTSPNPRPQDSTKATTPDWWLMVRKFLEQGTGVASFAPSSRFLARTMIKGIDYDKAKCIVELGAGTGSVTKEILARVRPHTKFMIVERDPDFCNRLRNRFAAYPNADIIEGDAAHIDTLLAERGLTNVDEIVSGLPLPSFPTEVRDAIIASSARALGHIGSFRQLTVMPWVYRKLYKGYFSDVRFHLVPINMPPAGVYVCRGYKFHSK
ncbi:MAG: rRNA adenine N-6-methyltransferase family protein [Fimbriiglobus sp.]